MPPETRLRHESWALSPDRTPLAPADWVLTTDRGVIVSYESIRQWYFKLGSCYARSLRRRQGRPGNTRFLDEVFVNINGERRYLW